MNLFFKILIIAVTMLNLISCKDILSTEPRYEKEIISEELSPSDSLGLLNLPNIDLGIIRVKGMITRNVVFTNSSENYDISIYKIESTNQTGLFSYEFPNGLPIEIQPLDNTEIYPAIEVTFIADTIAPGIFYDTLYINENKEFYIPIKVQTRY